MAHNKFAGIIGAEAQHGKCRRPSIKRTDKVRCEMCGTIGKI